MKKTATKSKKKTVKKAAPKQKLVREENVEFMLETPEQAREVCAHLMQLESTLGWIYLKKMLQASMLVIQDQILSKRDLATGAVLTEPEVDELRMSYQAYKELINKPAQLIENITQGNKPTSPEYDPYAKGIKNGNEQYAGVMEDDL